MALLYLARHQSGDGSWGGVCATCTCARVDVGVPLGIIADPGINGRVDALIDAFEAPDVDSRTRAGMELLQLGARAVPRLQEGLRRTDPEAALRCRDILEQLYKGNAEVQALARRAAAPRARSAVETTGLSLLCFLGAGYTHLSRDVRVQPMNPRQFHYGEIIKAGLTWLVGRQDGNGAFDSKDPAGNAVAALALFEAYGMTDSPLWKESAQKACDYLLQDRSDDARACAWKAMALMSAELDKLEGNIQEERKRLQDLLSKRVEPLARSAGFILARRGKTTDDGALVGDLHAVKLADLGSEELLFVTLGRYHSGGPKCRAWLSWQEPLRDHLLPGQILDAARCGDGSWEDAGVFLEVETCALRTLSLLAYYRYASHFGLFTGS